MNNDFGIIYIATGDRYRFECMQSAMSAKAVMPDVPISLWTDSDSGLDQKYFDHIHIINNPNYSFFDKILPLTNTEYQKNLFLDTDTFVLHSVYEIFDLLERFDLACCHATSRIPKSHVIEEIPVCFPELNTGVLAFNKNELTFQLIRDWADIYSEQLKNKVPVKHDQLAFRKALYFSDIRSTILTPEYNMRLNFPVFKGANSVAKILHGRDDRLRRAIQKINSYDGVEIYDFRINQSNSIKNKIKRLIT